MPRTIIGGQGTPIVAQPTATTVITAASDYVTNTLNGVQPSDGLINNPIMSMQQQQLLSQNPWWQGLCNPMINPFVIAAQSGFQSCLPGVNNAVPPNNNSMVTAPIMAAPVVTTQPGVSFTRPAVNAQSTLPRQGQPANRIAQPNRRAPIAIADQYDPYEQDSDLESDSDQGEPDNRSFMTSYDHIFEQDQFGMDHNEQAEAIATQKLSELFAATRINPILEAARDQFGLYVEEDEDTQQNCSLLFGGVGIGQSNGDPIMAMPNDVYNERDKLAKRKWRAYPDKVLLDAFKVPLSDHKALFCHPVMDKEVEVVLPGMGKGSYKQTQLLHFSPYWEKELCNMDNHLRLISRLSSFQLTIANYLLTIMDVENDDSPSGLKATATLVNDLAAQQLKAALALSMRTVTLRRENVQAFLRKVYVNELTSDLRKLAFSEEFLFGSQFGKTVRSLAKKLKDKKSLQVNLKPLASSRGRAKTSGGSRQRPQNFSSRGRGGYRGRPRGGKRGNSFRNPPAAAGGPPKAKKPRTGGNRQSL